MRYLGGKSVNGMAMANVINQYIKKDQTYWEPFVGAAGCMQHIVADRRFGSDIDINIISMHLALQHGWVPPKSLSEHEYKCIKGNIPKCECDYAMAAFVGYGCSFGGKWFGGYARDNAGYDYVAASHKSAVATARLTQDVIFYCAPYTNEPPEWDVCYLDPPYVNTTKPGRRGHFDTDEFWGWVDSKRKDGKTIFVSSFEAPNLCREIWSRKYSGLASKSKGSNIERLFIVE